MKIRRSSVLALTSVALASLASLSAQSLVACSSNNGSGPSSDDAGPSSGDGGPGSSDGSSADAHVDATPGTDASPGANDSGPDAKSGDGGTGDAATAGRVVYVESNDIAANQNSVLAFSQAADGTLTPLTGSPFMTAGTGVGNPTQALGPDDTDQEIELSADGSRLYAVNAGSNTIAVFDVNTDGSLSAVAGSPFASGGVNPVSVGLTSSFAYVVNQDEDPAQDAAAGAPGYFALPLLDGGGLGASTSMQAAGKSPQLALTSANGKLLFGLDFMAPLASGAGPLRAFAIQSDGSLVAAPGTPLAIPAVDGGTPPGTPLALGLALHPSQDILYVGFVLRGEIGAYSYDGTSGALTYVASAAVTGPAPCWIRANADGSRLYVTTTGDDGVSVLDTSTPLAPKEIQHLVLKDSGPLFDGGNGEAPTSQSYEENLSPDGNYLFVLSERLTTDPTVTTGNVLHVLTVASDGTLTESVADVPLNVAVGVRPQGVAVR
jgi:DNA-binding beta-propeller fold protein YncE